VKKKNYEVELSVSYRFLLTAEDESDAWRKVNQIIEREGLSKAKIEIKEVKE